MWRGAGKVRQKKGLLFPLLSLRGVADNDDADADDGHEDYDDNDDDGGGNDGAS